MEGKASFGIERDMPTSSRHIMSSVAVINSFLSPPENRIPGKDGSDLSLQNREKRSLFLLLMAMSKAANPSIFLRDEFAPLSSSMEHTFACPFWQAIIRAVHLDVHICSMTHEQPYHFNKIHVKVLLRLL